MTKKFTTADGYSAKDLIQYGIDNLLAAESLLNTSPSFYDSAGYLLHLGVESILKARHLDELGYFTKTHSLLGLVDKLREVGCPLEMSMSQSATLCELDLYQELRYPEPGGSPEIGTDSIDSVGDLVQAIWDQAPAHFTNYFDQIDPSKKGKRILMVRDADKE